MLYVLALILIGIASLVGAALFCRSRGACSQ